MPARYHTCSLLRGLGLDRNVDLDGDCDLSRVLDLEHVINPVSDRDRDLDLPNALDRTRDLVSAFDRARAGISTLLNHFSRVSIRARDLAVVRQRDDEATRVINLVRDLNLDGNRDSDLAGTVEEQDREGRVAPSAGRLLTAAAKLLPAADRARYAEEYGRSCGRSRTRGDLTVGSCTMLPGSSCHPGVCARSCGSRVRGRHHRERCAGKRAEAHGTGGGRGAARCSSRQDWHTRAGRAGLSCHPQHSPAQVMLALLEAFPAREPVVVLLDNLESVMDAEHESLTESALHQALSAVLTAPAHAVTVIATTRVTPTALVKVEPARQRQLRLAEGLDSPDAQIVLRSLDDDGHLGLRDAAEELLDGLREHTRGFPRALEAVKAILDGDATLTPRDLLDRTRHLPENQVVQALVGEAYELLDTPAKQVMQALAVCPGPVSTVGVDFLLQPVNPTIDAAPILTRLVRSQLARFQDRHYYLHPVDRDYAARPAPTGRSR